MAVDAVSLGVFKNLLASAAEARPSGRDPALEYCCAMLLIYTRKLARMDLSSRAGSTYCAQGRIE